MQLRESAQFKKQGGYVPQSFTWDWKGGQKMDQELQNGQTLMTKGGGGTYLR
jgi:hypothetical protein